MQVGCHTPRGFAGTLFDAHGPSDLRFACGLSVNGRVESVLFETQQFYTMVASANTTLYFGHKIALKYSADKQWLHGFFIHLIAYYIVFVIQVAVGWPLVRMMGLKPL
jgi:hypothetical protein